MLFKIALYLLLLYLFIPIQLNAQRSPTLGEHDAFQDGVSNSVSSVRLSDDKVLIAYKDGSSSSTSDLYVKVGTISGSNISYGTALNVQDSTRTFSTLVALSPTRAVIMYEKYLTAGDKIKYQILDIDGSSVSASSAALIGDGTERGWQQSLKGVALTNDLLVVAYEANLAQAVIRFIAGTVNGSTITWGTAVDGDDDVSNVGIARLSNSKFAVAYEYNDGANGAEGKVIAGTVSGTTITPGTAQSFESSSAVGTLAISALSSSEVVVAYEDDGHASDIGKIFYATVSGTTFSFPGSTTSFYTGGDGIDDVAMDALSGNEVLLMVDGGSGDNSVIHTGVISSNNVSLSSEVTFRAGQADDPCVNALTSDLAVLNYTDDEGLSGTTDRGESRVVTFSSTTNPEINVQGNSVDIELGDSSPSTTDHTDFGTGYSLSRTFTIQNTGSGTLTLGSNAVSITGTNASDFSVSSQPPTTVSGSSNTTFTIDFSSIETSTRSAEVHINSDDIHESDYFFSIQAVGDNTGVWDGSSGTDWGSTSNWADNSVPGSSDNVTIPASLSNYPTIGSSTTASCNNLTVESGASLILDSDASNTASLIVSGTFSGSITAKRYMTSGSTGWHLTGTPVGGQDIKDLIDNANNSFTENSTKYGLGVYNENDDSWTTYTTTTYSGAGDLVAGMGYETNIESDGTVEFSGTVNTSQVDIGITRSGNGWNLLGNPYPCSLHANDPAHSTNNFIDINTAVLDDSYEALYFWNASTSQYDIINNSSSATYIPSGQAFFVKSVSGGGTASFTTAMRTHQTGATFKTSISTTPQIIVRADNGEQLKSTEFRFIEGTTLGLDPGYDAGMFNGNISGFQFYSRLMEDNGVAFALQCLPTDNYEAIEVPLAFYSTSNEISFSAETINFPDDIKVYIEDRLHHTYTRLDEADASYTTEVGSGEIQERFYLHTSPQALDQLSNLEDNEIRLIPNVQNSIINIVGDIEGDVNISVIDISGRTIYQAVINENEIKVPGLLNGIYIVKLSGSGITYIQKINWIN